MQKLIVGKVADKKCLQVLAARNLTCEQNWIFLQAETTHNL